MRINAESYIPRGARRLVQGLVYIFIALAALGVAGAAYFGLTFTPIEAFVTAIAFGCLAVMLLERSLRQRSEARLERAIEDLARLLSTDAQAGAVLSQRINALADTDAGSRLDAIEADVSVLGTVVRQVAEAVAEQEEARRSATPPAAPVPQRAAAPAEEDSFPEPVIPAELLREAIDDSRLIFHIEPLLALPQRRPYGYDLVPRLRLDEGELADPPDFMPRRGHSDLVRRIEAMGLDEAIVIARRARTAGQPIRLFPALSRATISNPTAAEQLLATLEANRAVAEALAFTVSQHEWQQLMPSEKSTLAQIGQRGAAFSLTGATSLRFDFGELEGIGFTTVRFDATRFLRQPASFTDFHTADIAPYAKRFHLDLVATGILDEKQLLSLFEDGIVLVQGPHISGPGPVRPDLLVEHPAGAAAERRRERV
ncbi:MAG TPA: EAL domain-containing protein [Devosiaceae bacterium]|jgi:cyclic-di-GMP phosphodiesterase TipF (flagellum assembly factor)|nr:EAL domain-containing protein [Devosiaceae bacterium]